MKAAQFGLGVALVRIGPEHHLARPSVDAKMQDGRLLAQGVPLRLRETDVPGILDHDLDLELRVEARNPRLGVPAGGDRCA